MLIVCGSCRRQYDVAGLATGEQVRCLCSQLLQVPEPRDLEARRQRCSACGARLADGAATCSYCSAAVIRADRGLGESCPQCFARLAAGDRFCGACGLEIRPERIAVVPADARCPRCSRALSMCSFESGESYVECSSCGGLWLPEAHFEAIVAKRDRSPLGKLAWERAQREEAAAHEGWPPVAYLACPRCRERMHRKNYANASGVIIDWCKGHGFWFDAAELERILRFVERGGLDRARERNLEQQRFEAERLEARTERARRSRLDPAHQQWLFSEADAPRSGPFLADLARWIIDALF
ncbi:MAG: zinc ribbon domain-containing protein [Planctomycetes bacterium]|nr:zinc ribbon domain-containing protein [Planctomycetota bacterium]